MGGVRHTYSMTTQTVTPADLRPRDRIVAVDGTPVSAITVTGQLDGNRVRLASPHSKIERWLYADQHETLTVQRPEPKPRRRTIDGLTLISHGPGEWKTEDGRHGVSYQSSGLYVCDRPHVVRHTLEERARTGRRGHYCWGEGEEHENAPEWCAWSDDSGVDMDAHAWEPRFESAASLLTSALRAHGLLR